VGCTLALVCGAGSQTVFKRGDYKEVPTGTILISGAAIPPGAGAPETNAALAGTAVVSQWYAVYDAITVEQKLANTASDVRGDIQKLNELIGEEHAIVKTWSEKGKPVPIKLLLGEPLYKRLKQEVLSELKPEIDAAVKKQMADWIKTQQNKTLPPKPAAQ
jgi:hypothetical protein